MSKENNYKLMPDKIGMIWDLLLYLPTVSILSLMGVQFWYQGNAMLAYLLCFLASYFALMGGNRILKTRLMWLPKAPVNLVIGRQNVDIGLRNGDKISLVKDVRFFSDFAGRSFGLSGMDLSGRKLQFVIHKGQFAIAKEYEGVVANLKKFR